MMKRYQIYIFILLAAVMGGCVQEDINEALRREAELNSRIEKVKEWCANANREIELLFAIINLEKTGDYIESVTDLQDGSGYTVVFHQSGTITIKHGATGNKGENGEDGNDGGNGADGAPGADGTPGTDGLQGGKGDTPLLGAAKETDGKYYWTVQLGSAPATWLLDRNENKVLLSSGEGITPQIGIEKDVDGKFYWQQTIGTDTDWIRDTGGQKIPAEAVDGTASIFRSVDSSNPDYVVFTMADGSRYNVRNNQQISALDFRLSGPVFFRRGTVLTLPFVCGRLQSLVKESGQWDVRVNYIAGETEGSVTVEAPSKGSPLPASERITIKGTDAQGNTVRASIIVTLYYRFELPGFKSSYVYDLFLQGRKIGEICQEYVPDYSETERAAVVYPYNVSSRVYGAGVVVNNGAVVQHDGTGYTLNPGSPVSDVLLTEDGSSFKMMEEGEDGVTPEGISGVKANLVTDAQGYSYRTVKIGSQYWMAENLRTTQLNDGTAISTGYIPLDWMIAAAADTPACRIDEYADANSEDAVPRRDVCGILYNRFAMLADIAPRGWHIPSEAEFQMLKVFVGDDARKLKSTAVGTGIGEWNFSTGIDGNNITGFTALAGALVEGSSGGILGLGTMGQWWTTDYKSRMSMTSSSNVVEWNVVSSDSNQVVGEGNSIRCIRDVN